MRELRPVNSLAALFHEQAGRFRLAERGVKRLGAAGLEESPQAYKPISEVIAAQADLVDIIGTFRPRLVRMVDEAGDG